VGATGVFDRMQIRQLRTVLRMAGGERVTLFDGTGVEADALYVPTGKDAATFEVVEMSTPEREPPIHLTVGLALLRGERFEFALQKLTEIGVACIVPLAAQRCVVSFDVAREWPRRRERYERIIREAAEQSERLTLVALESPVPPSEFFGRQPTIALIERADAVHIADVVLIRELAIAIGPEGGWTDRERDAFQNTCGISGSLGSLILRAETAAIVAAGTLVQRAWATRWGESSEL